MKEAILFASHYEDLVYFAHALEMMLFSVVEEDATSQHDSSEDGDPEQSNQLLPDTVEFLDHFDVALDVIVGCARKIEMARWPRLFDIVGNPKNSFPGEHTENKQEIDANQLTGVLIVKPTQDSWVLFVGIAWA